MIIATPHRYLNIKHNEKGKKMKNKLFYKTIIVSLCGGIMAGCATIMGSDTQVIPISSNPKGASIVITDEKGKEMFNGNTPATVALQKGDGTYWGKKNYTVTISKVGYKPQVIPITASANGWYIAGNLVFGGLIGWFVVDPVTGKMYNLSPENIDASLNPTDSTSYNAKENNGIAIMLIDDVPPKLREEMKPLN